MREVIRCADCSLAALKYGVGFAGRDELHCTGRSGTVEPDDGCTFGTRGQPGVAVADYDVTISGHEAVCGYHW